MDDEAASAELFDDDNGADTRPSRPLHLRTSVEFTNRAAEAYDAYATQFKSCFKWPRPDRFVKSLAKDLAEDAASLLDVLTRLPLLAVLGELRAA